MSAVRDNNYFVVHGWMINQLGLKGNELQIYAIIYGFSQTDGQRFRGSLQYLADWTNATKRTAINSLQALTEKGLLLKEEFVSNGIKACEYRCVTDGSGVVKNLHRGDEKTSPGVVKNLHRGDEKTSPNIISDKDIDMSIDREGDKPPAPTPEPEPEPKTTRFKPPTVEEVATYCRERGKRAAHIDPQRFIDYYTAANWMRGKTKIKDWKACVRTWERGSDQQPAPQISRSRIRTEQEHNAGQHASGFGWGE